MKVTSIVALHLNLFGLNTLMRVILSSSCDKNTDLLHAKTAKRCIGEKNCAGQTFILCLSGVFFVHRCQLFCMGIKVLVYEFLGKRSLKALNGWDVQTEAPEDIAGMLGETHGEIIQQQHLERNCMWLQGLFLMQVVKMRLNIGVSM